MSTDPGDLANLHDIVLPDAVPYWPPAPGWWIIGLSLALLLAITVVRAVLCYRRNAYRRRALVELAAIGPITSAAAAGKLSEVLKRAALVAFPRVEIASLTGERWMTFLDRSGGTRAFTEGEAAMLPALAYGARAASLAEGQLIAEEAQRWLRRHRADPGEATC